MIKQILLALVALILAFGTSAQAQDSEPIKVVASFSILTDVVRQIGGDAVEVTSLIPIGTDPHSFEPTPQEVVALADADVVFVNGVNFEESLLETIENAGEEMNIVTVSQCVEILPFEHDHADEEETDHTDEAAEIDSPMATQCVGHDAELGLVPAESQEEHEHLGRLYALECGHHEEESGEEHAHAAGSCDGHVWTDPVNVMYWSMLIRDTLSAIKPDQAEFFAENAAAYIATLTTLQAEIQPMIDSIPAENRILVTNHETLGYFAHHYGFELVGVVIPGGSAIAEPSAGEIAAMIDVVREEGVAAVFAENTTNPDLAEQIADEAGVDFYTLYTDSLHDSAPTYVDYMRYNVETIVNALSQ